MTLKTYLNLSDEELFELSVNRGEGVVAANGALVVSTGERTGRSPKDRFIVCDDFTEDKVAWNEINQPIASQDFEKLWQDVEASLYEENVFISTLGVGQHPAYQTTVRVRTTMAWQLLFCRNLFIKLASAPAKAEWQLLCVGTFVPDGKRYNLPGKAAVVLDFTNKRILICGTQYAGEMKKAMFSVLNFLLPPQDILPMHCSANVGAAGDVALFFGLSGTGKTTLSADPQRRLIGDDEHGWGADGIFNFEGGCYAKCINLSPSAEPIIWNALKKPAILENVAIDLSTRELDFDSAVLTQNTRAAYPLSAIPNRAEGSVHNSPRNVIFLACDLFGVLPPVAKLTEEQIVYYFLSGYTALIGSTEVGNGTAIRTTFSQCFGAPFFPLPAQTYANLLLKRIRENNSDVFLVNTGWYGGKYGEGGERYPISVSRQIINSILNHDLAESDYQLLPRFNLMMPKALPNCDVSLLDPRRQWSNQKDYESAAEELLGLFATNYKDKGFDRDLPVEEGRWRFTSALQSAS